MDAHREMAKSKKTKTKKGDESAETIEMFTKEIDNF